MACSPRRGRGDGPRRAQAEDRRRSPRLRVVGATMSRIGRKPVVPRGQGQGRGRQVRAEGRRGKLIQPRSGGAQREARGQPAGDLAGSGDHRRTRALHGLTRALVANMVPAASRTASSASSRSWGSATAPSSRGGHPARLGYSHPVIFPLPEGVHPEVERQVSTTLATPTRPCSARRPLSCTRCASRPVQGQGDPALRRAVNGRSARRGRGASDHQGAAGITGTSASAAAPIRARLRRAATARGSLEA